MENRITYEKEYKDTTTLSQLIKKEDWVDEDTILVCCSPIFSSITTQLLNHSLSKSSPLDQLFLEIPLPNMSQILNRETLSYEQYEKYIIAWVNKLERAYKYLFISSHVDITNDKHLSLLSSLLRNRISSQFVCLYIQSNSLLKPSIYIETHSYPIKYEWQQ